MKKSPVSLLRPGSTVRKSPQKNGDASAGKHAAVQRRVSFSGISPTQRLRKSPLIADVPESSPRTDRSKTPVRRTDTFAHSISADSQPRKADSAQPSPGALHAASVTPVVPDISLLGSGDPRSSFPIPELANLLNSAAYGSPVRSVIQASSFAPPSGAQFTGPVRPDAFLHQNSSFLPFSAPVLVKDSNGLLTLDGLSNASPQTAWNTGLRSPGTGHPAPYPLDVSAALAPLPFGFPYTGSTAHHGSLSYDGLLAQRLQQQDAQIFLLRSQLQQCIEMYNVLSTKMHQKMSPVDAETQTGVTECIDAETMTEESTNKSPALPHSGDGVLEKADISPAPPCFDADDTFYAKMMANVQAVLQNPCEMASFFNRERDDDGRILDGVPEHAVSNGANDLSMACSFLARKYLDVGRTPGLFPSSAFDASVYGIYGADVSIATQDYLSRHGLTTRIPPRTGFLRTESIIEWAEDEDENGHAHRIQETKQGQYYQDDQRLTARQSTEVRRAFVSPSQKGKDFRTRQNYPKDENGVLQQNEATVPTRGPRDTGGR